MKRVAKHQTTRATARIGIGVAVAAIALDYFQPAPHMVVYWQVLIIVAINECAYVIKRLLNARRGAA